MLYFKALFDGLDAMPAADPAIARRARRSARAEGWPALHAELARVDPVAAARIAPRDAQRIQRALEVHRVDRRSRCRQCHTRVRRRRARAADLARAARPRAGCMRASRERFAAMLDAGFVDEVRALRARGDLHRRPAVDALVGYRQAWAALDGGDLDDAAGDRHRGDAPARQAPADVAAQHAAARTSSPATTPMRPTQVVQSARACAEGVDRERSARDRSPALRSRGGSARGREVQPERAARPVDPLSSRSRPRQALRRRRRLQRRRPRRRARRVRRGGRRVGRRQVDPAELHRRARRDRRRLACASPAPTSTALDEAAQAHFRREQPRLRVPGLPCAAAPERRAQRRLPLLLQAPARRGARREVLAAVGLDGLGDAPAADAVGRPAPARRDRARAGAPAAADPRRRADRQPRPARPPSACWRCCASRCAREGAACVLVTHSRAAAARADRVLTLTPAGIAVS